MQTYSNSALRVADMIAATKKILIGLIVVGVALTLLVGAASANGGVVMFALLWGVLVGGIWAVMIYVLFGWFEHTLRVLVAIAQNTSRSTV